MKYYVVSDIHGYYDELIKALTDAGWFEETEPHKLIVCGDMMDRGEQAVLLQEFMMDLKNKDMLIFIRGNHEDLMVEMITHFYDFEKEIACQYSYHNSNGTWNTALQLSRMSHWKAITNPLTFLHKVEDSPFYKELMPSSVNYFEDGDYIFVHGYIPCYTPQTKMSGKSGDYRYMDNWRNASKQEWNSARWVNGMMVNEVAGIVEPGKTIVVGHWHTSWAHSRLEHKGTEWGPLANFNPYVAKNVIGIDGCTAYSGKVNCLVISV